MPLIEKLQLLKNNVYKDEDNETYSALLLDGMNDLEIENFKEKLPNRYLPTEIEEVLRFSKGFSFYGLDVIRFDAYGEFGFEELFPRSIQLAGDGYGNFWILDIDSSGNWKEVYYICHDPAVVIKHSDNLEQFIDHIDEFGKKGTNSHLDFIHEQTVYKIWNTLETPDKTDSKYNFEKITLPEFYQVFDLKNKPLKSGFAWGKSGPRAIIIRPDDNPLWIIEQKTKKGFWAKLFGK